MDIQSRLLLIDDEADFRQVIASSLLKHGFEVLEATDGKAGVSLATEALPDLVMCDLDKQDLSPTSRIRPQRAKSF